MKILAIECATEHCSAALWLAGELHERESGTQGPGHGESLLPMVQSLLSEGNLALSQLDAIAVSRGPGAFTGVRLGISVAQGLAFSAGLPVFGFSTLQVVAAAALQADAAASVALICQDARMGELYSGTFSRSAAGAVALSDEYLSTPAALDGLLPLMAGEQWTAARHWCGAGSGFDAYVELRQRWPGRVHWQAGIRPQAAQLARLAAAAGLGTAIAPELLQPVYLRDEVAQRESKN